MSTGVVKQPSSHFREIPRDECEALLAAQRTGRVVWNPPDGPQVLPVTYGVYAGDIVFRTSPHGVLAQLAELPHSASSGFTAASRARRSAARGGSTAILHPSPAGPKAAILPTCPGHSPASGHLCG